MTEIFGVPLPALMGQLTIGLVNGCFYAMLSLGLAVIFGMLNVVNFAHGALYMLGAFFAWLFLHPTDFDAFLGTPFSLIGVDIGTPVTTLLYWCGVSGINYWFALILAPLCVALVGALIERTMLRRLYQLDHLYGLLLTFGIALLLEGIFLKRYGSSGMSYELPPVFNGSFDLDFMRLPKYRAWVVVVSVVVCLSTWFVIERTKLGAYLRAGTENPKLVQAFGINVPLMMTLTYAFGVGLGGLAGVMAAPIYLVGPLMGSNIIIIVFAVVVIGGMGSIMGSIVTGLALGLIEGLTKVYYPEASAIVVFVIMVIVLLIRPAGLFGREK